MAARLDHLVVTADRLGAGAEYLHDTLGLMPGPGGDHAAMGTHNRLLSLGPQTYLEAIAVDPDGPEPGHKRWFGLDQPPTQPRLSHWALRVDDLDVALADAPEGIGVPVELQRGDYRWRITVPEDGKQPFGGLFPALIEWQAPMPAPALEDHGARLVSLVLSHPDVGALGWALSMLTEDDRVIVRKGPAGLSALIHTETGEKVLS
ncbi:MAG: VOC family protein [Maritimibacter sp.]